MLIAVNGLVDDGDDRVMRSGGNSCSRSPSGHIYLRGIDWVIPLSPIILFSGLVPLSVVNLSNSLLL